MKYVTQPQKIGVAAREVRPMSSLRRRNPAIKEFNNGTVKQVVDHDEIEEMAGMNGLWDDITSGVSDAATKLWSSAVDAGQKAATTYVQKQLVRIVGADGKIREVEVGSPDAIAYQQQQQQIAYQQQMQAQGDNTMKYLMWAGMGLGGIVAVALIVKMLKK